MHYQVNYTYTLSLGHHLSKAGAPVNQAELDFDLANGFGGRYVFGPSSDRPNRPIRQPYSRNTVSAAFMVAGMKVAWDNKNTFPDVGRFLEVTMDAGLEVIAEGRGRYQKNSEQRR
jgi:hypothetical protein